jgi:hypothetical protein
MLLNIQNTIIYSPGICRTGTTSLLEKTTLDNYTLKLSPYVIKNQLNIKNKHIPWEIMNKNKLEEINSNLYMFSLVRNPWSRIFSQWKRDRNLKRLGISEKGNFNEFIQKRLDPNSPPSGDNYRWWTNLRWLGGVENIDRYNYIGKFENFNTSLDIVLKDINNLTGVQVETSKLKKVNSFSEHPKEYIEYYDVSSISKVRELYKEDIEYFNYEYED